MIIIPLNVKQQHLLNPLNVKLGGFFLGWEVVEEFHFGMIIGAVGKRNHRGAAGVGGTAGGALGPARNTPVGGTTLRNTGYLIVLHALWVFLIASTTCLFLHIKPYFATIEMSCF